MLLTKATHLCKMAIVLTGSIVTSIKGSVGGTTFQSSAAGLVMRNKPKPVGKGSNKQLQQRNIIAQLTYYWSNLTDAQRQVWSSLAIYVNGTGKTNNQNNSANTGKTQFFAVNSWLLIYGKPYIVTPTIALPLQQNIPCPPFFTESNTLGKTSIALNTATEILVVQVSLPQSVSTNTANTGLRTLVYNMVNGTTQDWSAAYLQTFGVPLTLGKKYWIQLLVVNFITGQISPKAKALVLYTNTLPVGIGYGAIGSTFIIG